jgi:hypothetical protein
MENDFLLHQNIEQCCVKVCPAVLPDFSVSLCGTILVNETSEKGPEVIVLPLVSLDFEHIRGTL